MSDDLDLFDVHAALIVSEGGAGLSTQFLLFLGGLFRS